MIIGLVLLGLTVVLMFFGVAQRVFKSFGVTYWLAFVIVGALIGCAFIPSFSMFGIEVNVAGFAAPVVFSGVFFYFAHKVREAWRAAVAATVTAAMYIATELLLERLVGPFFTALIGGVCCGGVAYVVGRTKISSVTAAFCGLPLGDVIASAVGLYTYGTPIRLGSPAAFDAVILAAVTAILICECVAAVKRAKTARRRAFAEAAEEFDPDEYKRYFGD